MSSLDLADGTEIVREAADGSGERDADRWSAQLSKSVAALLSSARYGREPVCTRLVDEMLDHLAALTAHPGASLRTFSHRAEALGAVHASLSAWNAEDEDGPTDVDILDELRQLAARCADPRKLGPGEELCLHHHDCLRSECLECSSADSLLIRESFVLSLAESHRTALHSENVELADQLLVELLRCEDAGVITDRISDACTDALLAAAMTVVQGGEPVPQNLLQCLRRRSQHSEAVYEQLAYGLALTTSDKTLGPLFAGALAYIQRVTREAATCCGITDANTTLRKLTF